MSRYLNLHRLGVHDGGHGIEVSSGVMDVMDDRGSVCRIAVDCGLSPRPDGQGNPWTVPDLRLLTDGRPVDAVFITHVHGDHAGALPAMEPFLAKHAKIHMSRMTRRMLGVVLEDGLNINRRRGDDPPFNERQLRGILARVAEHDRPGEFQVAPGIAALIHPAGHIPGACSFTFRIGKVHVHYSGDRCEHDQPGILGATPLPSDWTSNLVIAGSDCTYGAEKASDLRDWQEQMDKGAAAARRAIERGRPAIFFTFGVHRGGAVAHELCKRGLHELAPIYLDGSCRKLTAIANDPRNMWCDLERMMDVSNVTDIRRRGDRENVAHGTGPYIVIGTPGMGGPGGAMTFWREYVLPDPDAAAIFTGFVAPGTDGDLVLQAARERKPGGVGHATFVVERPDGRTFEQTLPIRCAVEQVRIGAHQSRRETIDWFRELRPMAAMLNHGSTPALDSLEQELQGDIPVIYRADRDASVEIDL